MASGELPKFLFCKKIMIIEHNSESITLGWSWGLLGAILKPFRRGLGSLGAVWEALGVVLGALGAVLGWSWELLGRSYGLSGRSWTRLERSRGGMLAQLKF